MRAEATSLGAVQSTKMPAGSPVAVVSVERSELIDGAGQHFMNDAVSAPGAIVRLVLHFRLTLVQLIEHRRFGVNYRVSVAAALRLHRTDFDLVFHRDILFAEGRSQTSEAIRPSTWAYSSSTEGTLPPTRP